MSQENKMGKIINCNKVKVFILVVSTIYFITTAVNGESVTENFQNIIPNNPLLDESLQLHITIKNKYTLNFEEQQKNLVEEEIKETILTISKTPKLIFKFSNFMAKNESAIQSFQRPILQNSKNCIISIVTIYNAEKHFFSLLGSLEGLLAPVVKPIIYKDVEKVIFTFTNKATLQRVLQSSFGRKLKYKVGILFQKRKFESLYTACEFCDQKSIFQIDKSIDSLQWKKTWPDYQKNMKSAIVRFSTPTTARPRLNYTFSNGNYHQANGLLNYAIRYIQKSLNFTLILKPASRGGGTGIKLSNGSWTGVMSEILNNEADIGMCTAETYSRTLVAGFSSALVNEPITFVSGPPQKKFVWVAIFWPFTGTVWSILLLLVLLSNLLMYVSYKVLNVPKQNNWKIGKIVEYFFGTLLGQCGSIPNKLPVIVNIYVTIWLLCGFIITTAYLSKLVGFLTFPVLHTIPQTAEELSNSNFDWGLTFMGGAIYSIMKASKTKTYIKLVNKMELTTDHIKCLTRTLDTRFICISYETIPKFYINKQLDLKPGQSPLTISKNYLLSLPVGVVMEKRAVFAPNVEKAVQSFTTAGLIPEWERQDFRKLRQQILKKPRKNTTIPTEQNTHHDSLLTFKHLHGAFIVLTTGIFIGLIVFLIEQTIQYITIFLKQFRKVKKVKSFLTTKKVGSKLLMVTEAKEYQELKKK